MSNDPNMDDFWQTYNQRIHNMSDEQLIDAYNREVGNNGWPNRRAFYLAAIHSELKASRRRLDCSVIADKTGLSLKNKVRLEGKKIVLL